jgi:hypothetical protein
VADAEQVRSAPPRDELPQEKIDQQFDHVYEKLFNKKRPTGDGQTHAEANPFTQDWRERLFDVMFSNTATFIMMTVVISLFFQITREHGEHKEYKRLTTARLDDAQRTLRVIQAHVHHTADAKREEFHRALGELEQTTGQAVAPEEMKRLVDQLLTSLVADIDTSLAEGTAPAPIEDTQPVAGGDTPAPSAGTGTPIPWPALARM